MLSFPVNLVQGAYSGEMTVLRKGKVVGCEEAKKEKHPVHSRRYLQSGGLRKILEQTRARHDKDISKKRTMGVQQSFERPTKEANNVRVVFDSPPAAPETEGETRGSTKKVRRSLDDEIDEMVQEAPMEVAIEAEVVTDQVAPELDANEVAQKI